MPVLTPQRMLKIASSQTLRNQWYLVAAVVMTVCNKPHEIPTIYHYAMQMNHLQQKPSLELYQKVQSIVQKFADIRDRGVNKEYSPYVNGGTDSDEFTTTERLREGILKTSALSGLPKAINSLMILKDTTPYNLRSHTLGKESNRQPIKTLEDYNKAQTRGRDFWDAVYGKVSHRIISQMSSSYPDLWKYAIEDVYSNLLSYCGILNHKETSLIVISCLIPQDVNPQLKGHLKGAYFNGVDVKVIRQVRELAIQLSQWCGVKWCTDVATI
ncbi:hypothetical protein BRETT_005121 [Brettanomyces bruxellensis]|uniref:Carboxymuconolactone decarboxylase-like domain-containing protein n=1 Tax=Dekkera bruxellensis TaxID=5007 RepID=A0A871R255_DEKBR|nr:uncharacterized protein BRETT_005121 [Brettanomyces bruxellensis]QOU20463.1 hypothetical protein BRETT_005121 [Brettanomyces bruxellensis]